MQQKVSRTGAPNRQQGAVGHAPALRGNLSGGLPGKVLTASAAASLHVSEEGRLRAPARARAPPTKKATSRQAANGHDLAGPPIAGPGRRMGSGAQTRRHPAPQPSRHPASASRVRIAVGTPLHRKTKPAEAALRPPSVGAPPVSSDQPHRVASQAAGVQIIPPPPGGRVGRPCTVSPR